MSEQIANIMKNTILIADDESFILRVIKYNLEKAGYNVLTALNGKEALDITLRDLPDLLILDIMMPKYTGYEVCSILKNNPRTKSLPIIMLTARGEDVDREKGFQAGADAYETKPFSPKALLQKVKELLRKNHQEFIN